MRALGLQRLPPGGAPIGLASFRSALAERQPEQSLLRGLERRLAAERVTLHASGREALRVAIAHLARRTGRGEVVVPAYGCFSLPASVVAAGLRVRLVDVTAAGQIDPVALERLPLERAAALVVANLFGVPEAFGPLRSLAEGAGVPLVDDAAQALGAGSPEGNVGARGDVGLLSFGRGKPLGALGGGALVWPTALDAPEGPATEAPRPLAAVARAAGYDVARVPAVFRSLSAIPSLHIGETVYAPDFRRGGIDGASLCLAAALLPGLDRANRERARRATRLAARLDGSTRFRPLLASEGATGVYPRLALVAPSPEARDRALEALAALGATSMYPGALDRIEALRPHLEGEAPCPGAEAFAARLLTLPTHAGLRGDRLEEATRTLERLA